MQMLRALVFSCGLLMVRGGGNIPLCGASVLSATPTKDPYGARMQRVCDIDTTRDPPGSQTMD